MGTDNLFEQNTILEIQEIEKKLRNDIERKKEELRQMVGERYRDLMEAADTIAEMKDIAKNVTLNVNEMEQNCVRLQTCSIQIGILNSVKKNVSVRKKKNEMLYSITAQIRILVDTPARIWLSIENKDFLNGMLLYLLACHTHSSLLLDPLYQEKAVFNYFPLINRQWLGINHLQHVLLQHCQDVLSALHVEPQEVTGASLCLAFLSDLSPRLVFQKILKMRKVAIQEVFKLEKYGYSAKTQICELVCAIQNTLNIFYAVFYPNEEDIKDLKTNLFLAALHKVTSHDLSGPVTLFDLHSEASYKYLPKTITEFRPILKAANDDMSIVAVQDSCKQWVQDVSICIQQGLEKSLECVKSAKALALVRDAVSECTIHMAHWDRICIHLLKQDFSIWDFFLKLAFVERVKGIITNQVESSTTLCSLNTEDTLKELCSSKNSLGCFETDISSYLWIESPSDITPHVGWIPHYQRCMWDGCTLSMKVFGFTPKIQSICKEVDKKLQDLLEDVSCFAQNSINQFNLLPPKGFPNILEPTILQNISLDAREIYHHLSSTTDLFFVSLIQHFQEICSSFSSSEGNYDRVKMIRVIFLGHLFHALSKLCPHLKLCILSAHLLKNVETLSKQVTPSHRQVAVVKEGQPWDNLKRKLLSLSNSAFRIWTKEKIYVSLRDFESHMKFNSAHDVLKMLTQWDKVEIQEESEDGTSVVSVLRIPQQISVPLFCTLHQLCCDINEIGCHSISSHIRSEICEDLLRGLLDVYKFQAEMLRTCEQQFNPRIAQTKSLQMLFDIQFLRGLIGPQEGIEKDLSTEYENLVNQVVSYIDPFDLDVFSSPLKTNLKNALQKSSLLLGLLASPDQIGHLGNLKAQPLNSQTGHSLMIVSEVTNRLPLLPLANRSQLIVPVSESFHSSDTSVKGSPLKASRSHSSSPNLSVSDSPMGVAKSASFYDRVTAMSSSWFGGN